MSARARHGFTILELMVVVAIIGLLTSMAAASLVLRSSRGLPNGVRDLQSSDLFNADAPVPHRDGFKRSLFHTAINTLNLLSRSAFMPALRNSAPGGDLNSWGG